MNLSFCYFLFSIVIISDISLDLGFHVTEFPYRSNNTSLFVLGPTWNTYKDVTMEDVTCIIEKMSSEEGRAKMCKLLDGDVKEEESDDFNIEPTFELEKDLPMHELLAALGVKELVQDTGINIGGFIAKHKKELHLSCAMHRIHVNVTKEVTIAGAVTAFYSGTEFSRPVRDERNSMFVWLIYDKLHQIVLIVGTINKLPRPPLRRYIKGTNV